MSLLTIIQDAADLLGLPRPSSSQSSDTTTRQLVALCTQEGEDLARRHDWRGLIVGGCIQGDGDTTRFILPADFDRLATGPALWRDGSIFQPLAGPVSGSDWVALVSRISVSTQKSYRLISANMDIWPTLDADDVVRFEYFATHWIASSDGASRRRRWQQDTDFALIPERLITLGLVWRWKAAKGLDYAEQQTTYEQQLAFEASADRAPRALAVGRFADDDLPPLYTPDTIQVA